MSRVPSYYLLLTTFVSCGAYVWCARVNVRLLIYNSLTP